MNVIDDRKATDQERWRNLNCPTIFGDKLIVQTVLARNERCAICLRRVITSPRSTNECTHIVWIFARWPTKIVEYRNARWICANTNKIANALINCGKSHDVWIACQPTCQSTSNCKAARTSDDRRYYRRISWTALANSNERLDDRSPLNFVVILSNDPRFTCDIWMR